MVLPEGFALPPLLYLLVLLAVLLAAAVVLWSIRPAVTDRTVLAIVPWMAAGGIAHALHEAGALPAAAEPFFGVPAVYLTLGATGGLVWVVSSVTAAGQPERDPAILLGAVGGGAAIAALIAAVWWGRSTETLAVWWPTVGLVASATITAGVWVAARRLVPETTDLAAWTGVVVVFGHALDGLSTAIGIDILGTGERSPVADAVIGLGGGLPPAELVGEAWLFILVKLALPVVVLVLFRQYLDEAPSQARLLLAVIAAVGLGPGVHNLTLFLLSA